MRRLFLLLFCFCIQANTRACLNLHVTDFGGHQHDLEPGVMMLFEHWMYSSIEEEKEYLGHKAADMLKENTGKWKTNDLSDYSVMLIKLGKLKEAKTILDTLILNHPNDYSITANYGTLMELMGKNALALKFIKRSVAIDPRSHDGSEWIHVKILEAKIELEKDKNWLKTHTVLGYSLGTGEIPDTVSIRKVPGVKEITRQILYQLEERTFFIQGKDEIVSDLFYTAASLFQVAYGNEYAADLYLMATDYGDRYKDICEKRVAYIHAHYKADHKIHIRRKVLFMKDSTVKIADQDSIKTVKAPVAQKPKTGKNEEKKKKSNFLFFTTFPPFLVVLVALVARKRRRQRKGL